MPTSNERISNRPLSGMELAKIIVADVQNILQRDGMFTNNIAYSRVKYEVRVTMHLDNPAYPEHIAHFGAKQQSNQQIAENPELQSLEAGTGPLTGPSPDALVVSSETERTIHSANSARLENDLPLKTTVRDPQSGANVDKDVKYTGDHPDPASVGNTAKTTDVSEKQAQAWGVPAGGEPDDPRADSPEVEKKVEERKGRPGGRK